jgi:hypothetical protein
MILGIWELNNKTSWLTPIKTYVVKAAAYFLGINAEQGSLAITNAASCEDAGPHLQSQGVGNGKGKGGGRYFNRTTEITPMPHSRDPDCRQRVWRKVNDELKLQDKGLLDVLGLDYVEGGWDFRINQTNILSSKL